MNESNKRNIFLNSLKSTDKKKKVDFKIVANLLYGKTGDNVQSEAYYRRSRDLYKLITENFSKKKIEDRVVLFPKDAKSELEEFESFDLDKYYLKNITTFNILEFSENRAEEIVALQERLLENKEPIFINEIWEILDKMILYAQNNENKKLEFWGAWKFYEFCKLVNPKIDNQYISWADFLHRAFEVLLKEIDNWETLNELKDLLLVKGNYFSREINCYINEPETEKVNKDIVTRFFDNLFLVEKYVKKLRNSQLHSGILKFINMRLEELEKIEGTHKFLEPYWKILEEVSHDNS